MRPSGITREEGARKAGQQARVVYEALELAILTALARAVRAAATGALSRNHASRQMRLSILAAFAQAAPRVRAILAQARSDARADVRSVIAADLGPLSRLLPAVPLPAMPRVAGDLRHAELEALNWSARAFGVVARELQRQQQRTGLQESRRQRASARAARLAAAQHLLTAAASAGVTGKVTAAGARIGLSAYASTAVAAGVASAHLAMQLRAMQDAGLDLVLVTRSNPKPPCSQCLPWVGKVLSVTGLSGGTAVIADAVGNPQTAQVAGTVAQARAAGLLHPYCQDSLTPFAAGAVIPVSPPLVAGAAGYAAAQQRRRRERQQRSAQRQAAVALTPQARTQARRSMSAAS
jgi:Phage minor capsid protein 2